MKSTLDLYILIFFLRGARINGRGQFAFVVERRNGRPFLRRTKNRGVKGKTDKRDCAAIYICKP